MSPRSAPGPGWPLARSGMAVGLLGGSFDPAHAGHAAITAEALRRFALDRVWWLVSPANPLKREGPASIDRRVAQARRVMRDPRVGVTDLESRIGSRFTADTVAALVAAYPGVRFVWLMGSDNLASFHRWDRWRDIADRVPIGVLARPNHRLAALSAPAARALAGRRIRESHALARAAAPAWAFATIPLRAESSSRLRDAGVWEQ